MKKKLFLLIFSILFLILPCLGLFAQGEEVPVEENPIILTPDVNKADSLFAAQDYYSAYIFYSRGIDAGVNYGISWYQTAYAHEVLFGADDPLLKDIYTIAFFYLIEQTPDHFYVNYSNTKIDMTVKVNKRFIKKTASRIAKYAASLGTEEVQKPALSFKEISVGAKEFIKADFAAKKERAKAPLRSIKGKEGFISLLTAVILNFDAILFFWVFLSIPTGILLPVFLMKKNSGKSLLVTYLLWFHWGWLGIHRFYLDSPLLGVVYSLTCGGFGIGWVIEGFLNPFTFKKA